MEKKLKNLLDQGKFKNVSEERSRTMAAIRAEHTRTTEYRLRMVLVRSGIKDWKLHDRELPGRPDFYFFKKRLAVFVDGCFWHGCSRCGHIPKTRTKFWETKIRMTKERDLRQKKALQRKGISVLRIWEHDLKRGRGINRILRKILEFRHD